MEKKFTTENFSTEVLASDKVVLVDFYADWCGPCRMVAPVVEQIAEEYADRAVVGKLNVDENEEIAVRYGVMSIPTLIAFKNGEVAGKLVGVQPKEVIERLILAMAIVQGARYLGTILLQPFAALCIERGGYQVMSFFLAGGVGIVFLLSFALKMPQGKAHGLFGGKVD